MAEVNGKELQDLKIEVAKLVTLVEAGFKDLREDMQRGRERMDDHDRRLRDIPDNRTRIDGIEGRVERLEKKSDRTMDYVVQAIIGLIAAGAACLSLFG